MGSFPEQRLVIEPNVVWRRDLNGLPGKSKQPKIHIASTFPGFDYSAHLNVCGDTVVLSDVKFAAGIHECLSENCFMESGQVLSIDLRALATITCLICDFISLDELTICSKEVSSLV